MQTNQETEELTIKAEKLQQRWNKLFSNLTPEENLCAHFEGIFRKYTESHRYYHTIEHLINCLNFFDTVQSKLLDPVSIEIAHWFHDVIYDPQRNDNEKQSAEYAKKVLSQIGLSSEKTALIVHLIMMTKHPSKPTTEDEKILIDIDLAILGSSDEAFAIYEQQIRNEYLHIPEAAYRQGRTSVLKSFIEIPQIYSSDYFHQRFEKQARKNLKQAITSLQ